jgi:septum formation protein
MRLLTRDQIDRYVASGEWREKAGAYAIQEKADAFIEKMEGSYSNVVGLPMELIERLFRQVQRCLPSQRR